MEVLTAANLFNKGLSYAKIAEIMYNDAKHAPKAQRNIKKWIIDYPRQFKAELRNK